MGWLKQRFQCPADAERHYFSSVDQSSTEQQLCSRDRIEQQLSVMSRSFSNLCAVAYGVCVPEDFILLSAKAMMNLKECHRSNVLYSIAKGLGVLRSDGSDSRFPMKRMPMGLLEYMAGFFEAEEMRKVSNNQ